MDSSFAVMDRAGIDAKYTVGREGWTIINCASKRAFGCGKSGNSAVQDLDLLLYRGDLENLYTSLDVRAGDKIFRWIDKVITKKGGLRAVQKDRYFKSNVEIVDKGIIVVTLWLSQYDGPEYYLVFDSVDRSLSMIPYIPDWATCYTPCPLPLRHDDGGYSLVLFGGEFGFGPKRGNNFLWRWSPSLAGISDSDPWQSNRLLFPKETRDQFFSPDVLFSSNGLAFWTDLALGTLCCDCSAVLAPADHPVSFTFIGLPPGYKRDRDEDTWSVKLYRTMGCVGGSIKFVSIDKPRPNCDVRGTRVTVWTLAPSRREWEPYSDFRLKNLFQDYRFKEAGLPKNLPMWPILREKEGANLYLILAEEEQTSDWGQKHYICRVDMLNKSLLQAKLLPHRSFIDGPVLLPSTFLEYLVPPTSRLDPILKEV